MFLEQAIDDRSSYFRGVGYSRPSMVVDDSPPTREAALARVRGRILAAARRGLSPADAEDLTQDALVLLTAKYAHVAAPEELVALGVKIVRLLRSAFWRRSQRRRGLGHVAPPAPGDGETEPLDNVAAAGAPDPETLARDRQRVRFLAEAVARLDGRCRDVLRRKLRGESFKEIAASLGRPVNTVYSWDHRCHKRLKKLLGAHLGFVSGEEER